MLTLLIWTDIPHYRGVLFVEPWVEIVYNGGSDNLPEHSLSVATLFFIVFYTWL